MLYGNAVSSIHVKHIHYERATQCDEGSATMTTKLNYCQRGENDFDFDTRSFGTPADVKALGE